jgi:signal transduction histidine kinase/HAMP domain-containing protein
MAFLDRCRIKVKLALIVGVCALALVAALAAAAEMQRQRMISDRIDKARAIVEIAYGLADSLEREVVARHLTHDEALARFTDDLRAMWYDNHQNYIVLGSLDNVWMIHPAVPRVEGTIGSTDLENPSLYLITLFTDAVRSVDEAIVRYRYPRPGQKERLLKITFTKKFTPWNAFIASGAYVDDIEAEYRSVLGRLALIGLLIMTAAAATAYAISRNISHSLTALKGRMEQLAAGDLTVDIREAGRQDEIGEMARTVQVFKDNALEKERMHGELQHKEELRRTAEGLRRSQERLAQAQRLAGMGSDFRDIANDVADWSDETYRIFGVARETFTPTTEGLLSLIHPDDRGLVLAARGEVVRGICPAPFDHRIVRRDGSLRIVRRETELLRDETGTVVSLAGTTHDVTEQRAAQKRQSELERQVLHSQKLDALGTLAGGIAHDLNNTLVPVLGLAKLTMGRMAEGSRERANIAVILKAGERARDLVRQILAFSRKDAPTRQPVDLAALSRESLKMLRATLPATVEIEESIDDVPQILADPAQLHQIVINLVVNAAQAIGDKMGKIVFQLAVAPSGALGTAVPATRLSVSDTGCGMDEATRQRIFEPFFTTKAVGEGTGLGLSVVHGIIAGHGGRITVASTLGEGTRFDILLPAISATEVDEIDDADPGACRHPVRATA